MKDNSWIKIYRRVKEKKWWYKQRFTWGQAWVDLLLRANHKDMEIVFDTGNYKVPKGSFITSQRELAKKWKWGIARVSGFLQYLQKTEHSIEYKTEHSFTHIYIREWEKYQEKAEHETEHKTERWRNTGGTLAETNKNVKNDKNSNKSLIHKEDTYCGKPKNPTDLQKLGNLYTILFTEKFEEEPTIKWGQFGKLFKPLLKQYGLVKLQEWLEIYMGSEDKFVKESGYRLEIFPSQINKIIAEKRKPSFAEYEAKREAQK